MKSILRIVCFVIFLLFALDSWGQLVESYFSDHEIKNTGQIKSYIKGKDCIIYGGSSFDNYLNQPSVVKLDTFGNIIWTTTKKDTSTNDHGLIEKIFKAEDHIYALKKHNYESPQIWKIKESNGEIEWKKGILSTDVELRHFIDYDKDKFLVGYYEVVGFPGTNEFKYAFVSKQDGKIISSYVLKRKPILGSSGIAIDSKKDIYFTNKDTIFKVSGSIPNTLIWESVAPIISQKVNYHTVYIDSLDNLILFGYFDDFDELSGKARVISLNSGTGQLIWEANTSIDEISTRLAFLDKNGYIYTTYQHSFVGSGDYYYLTSKIDKFTGNILWISKESLGYGCESARSLDVDNEGDVFLTGYYESSGYGPGNWGILKLDGNTGKRKYDLTISRDNLKKDQISEGISTCIINNKVYFIGQLEIERFTNGVIQNVVFVEIENKTGEVLQKKPIKNIFQQFSKTIKIEKYGINKTLVLKQVGRYTELEMYDAKSKLIWNKPILRNYNLKAYDLFLDERGSIVLTGLSCQCTNEGAITSSDLIYIFKIDSLGEIVKEINFSQDDVGIPTDVLCDSKGNLIFFYIEDYFQIYYGIIYPNLTYSYKISIGNNNYVQNSIPIHTKFVCPLSDSTAIYCNSNLVLKLDLKKNENTTFNSLKTVKKINYINKDKGNNINFILCGQDINKKDILTKFNISISDTIWKRTFDKNSEMYRFYFNSDSSAIYTIGTKDNKVVVRNILSNNGAVIWNYVYDCPSGTEDFPTDLSLDSSTGEITISGFSSYKNNKEAFIIVLNSEGKIIQEYLPKSSSKGENLSLCTQFLPDGSTWIGGQIFHNNYGKAGFIFKANTLNRLSTLSGNTYFDENFNGKKDSLERDLSFFKVGLQPTNSIQFTDPSGQYKFYADSGSFILSPQPIPNWEISSDSLTYHINLDTTSHISGLDFGYTPSIDTTLVSVFLNSGFTRCNQVAEFNMTAKNTGTSVVNGIFWLNIDPLVDTYIFETPPDTVVNAKLFGWHISKLYPDELYSQKLFLKIPGIDDGIEIGDLINMKAYVVINDVNKDTFYYTYTPVIRCSFDPNDKLVNPQRNMQHNYTLFDEQITYTIRFQNTGNDTAFRLKIIDTLDSNLDVNSLNIVSSSHLDLLKVTVTGNILEFDFNNIMLPDSFASYEQSQGYVTFTVMANKNLDEGTVISNEANIYFDLNPPVITNQTESVLVSKIPIATNVPEPKRKNVNIKVYPNPARNFFYLDMELPELNYYGEVKIYDLLGRELQNYHLKLNTDHFIEKIDIRQAISGLVMLKVIIDDSISWFKLKITD